MSFENKVVVVTGASSGIGKQTALILAAQKATVVLAARRKEELEKVAEEVRKAGGKALVVVSDVTKENDIKNLLETSKKTYERVDGVVLNAGVYPTPISILDVTEEYFDLTYSTNVKAVVFGLKYSIAALKENKAGGSIVVISSTVASSTKQPFAQSGVYASSKAAVNQLVRYVQTEVGSSIRINIVSPGVIETPMTAAIPKDFASTFHVANRVGRPEEIGDAITFLLSDKAAFIYGTDFIVDGGLAINNK